MAATPIGCDPPYSPYEKELYGKLSKRHVWTCQSFLNLACNALLPRGIPYTLRTPRQLLLLPPLSCTATLPLSSVPGCPRLFCFSLIAPPPQIPQTHGAEATLLPVKRCGLTRMPKALDRRMLCLALSCQPCLPPAAVGQLSVTCLPCRRAASGQSLHTAHELRPPSAGHNLKPTVLVHGFVSQRS